MSTINLYNDNFISAYYGIKKFKINVTVIVNENIINKKFFYVNNETFNKDPKIGKEKNLYIKTEKNKYKIKENNICYFINEEKFIDKHNINELNLLKDINIVRIFGKGPTFKNIIKNNKNELNVGINQTANFLTDIDILVMNDLHNIYKIDNEVFKKISLILIPEFLHIKTKYNKKGFWVNIYNNIKDKFNGYYIVYNLVSNKNKNPNLIDINIGTSSVNTATQFLCDNIKMLKHIDFYGTGIKSKKNYHNLFIGKGDYKNTNFIDRIKRDIKKSCKKISYNLN